MWNEDEDEARREKGKQAISRYSQHDLKILLTTTHTRTQLSIRRRHVQQRARSCLQHLGTPLSSSSHAPQHIEPARRRPPIPAIREGGLGCLCGGGGGGGGGGGFGGEGEGLLADGLCLEASLSQDVGDLIFDLALAGFRAWGLGFKV